MPSDTPGNTEPAADGLREGLGYIASLDVLGFSELLSADNYVERLVSYRDAVEDLIRPSSPGVECVVFSDTVVLTSPGDGAPALAAVLRATAGALLALIGYNLPVRGAIAFGRYLRDGRGGSVFLAGRPIVEAYRCEKGQKWIGAMLCPSVLRKQPGIPRWVKVPWEGVDQDAVDRFDTRSQWALHVQPARIPYQEPGKPTALLDGYAVVPGRPHGSPPRSAADLLTMIDRLEHLMLEAPTPELQARYKASLEWLRSQQEHWKLFAPTWSALSKKALKAKAP